MRRFRQHAPLVARAAPVSSRVARFGDQVEAEGDRAGSGGVIWPAWVQRCGIGSSCECPHQDQLAGVQRDLQAATAGGGAALPAGTRAVMEGAFAADFTPVRVHTGPASDRVASGLGARALTAGRDIVFGPGAFRPHTPGGARLLAHELAHVVQQASGLPRAAIDGGATDPLEKAAEAAAGQAVTSGRVAGLAPAPVAQARHLPPSGTGVGRSVACQLSHVVQRRSGATAIQRAPDNDDDEEPVVRGPRPIELMLRPDDPNMCGGRPCLTDEDLKPENLASRIPTPQAELNEEATRLGTLWVRRGQFIDQWEDLLDSPLEAPYVPDSFHKQLVDLGLTIVDDHFVVDASIQRAEDRAWQEIKDNDEALKTHRTAYWAADHAPEEESGFH